MRVVPGNNPFRVKQVRVDLKAGVQMQEKLNMTVESELQLLTHFNKLFTIQLLFVLKNIRKMVKSGY